MMTARDFSAPIHLVACCAIKLAAEQLRAERSMTISLKVQPPRK